MRVPLLAVSLWLLAVPLGAGAQAPPQPPPPPPAGEEGTSPITGERPVPGVPAEVGAHEHAGHPIPPTGAVATPPATGGSGAVTPVPDETKPPSCPCQPEDPAGPCPCPHHQDVEACPCRPEDATGPCPCPHHQGTTTCACPEGGEGTCACHPHQERERRRGAVRPDSGSPR